MTEDKLLDLVTDIAPRHEFIDPETGIKDFNVLGFSRELASSAEAAAIERCAELIDGMNDSAGDRASYDNREMREGEVERMNALSDAANAIRALLPKEES